VQQFPVFVHALDLIRRTTCVEHLHGERLGGVSRGGKEAVCVCAAGEKYGPPCPDRWWAEWAA
jgi:hypothetical protein